jgi:hypothetical protein
VSRANLPRIFEIRDCVAERGSSETYFQDFENSLANNSVKRKHFLHIETELDGLDLDAWTYDAVSDTTGSLRKGEMVGRVGIEPTTN